ncbi:disintegrin and metalloproteinase domain-containing protein 33 isoform X3 [Meriones unguiculatus]|uniref:disintegrin and metalloproteinase domain-containing protein 33 isoform X3 n=1 Tax=Meriones unguiculatus TaxID=10047 RepID=UPI00293EB834|nr:disintegrin and metalloproteinase domain-containing protein 33 isoform X3 [Meriones unguiculatus]
MGLGCGRPGGSPMLLLLLLLPPACLLRSSRTFPGNAPGEPVTPHWILDGEHWLKVTLEEPILKPDVVLVALEAEGRDLLLELEKNHRLLAPGYTETHYSPDGQPVVLFPNHTDHCHYHGRVRGFLDSWVALSICSGMRGLIGVSSNVSYYLYPWAPGDTEDFATHKIFRMEQLFPWRGARRDKDSKYKAGMASLPHVPQSRVRREARKSPRYLELYMVADHTLFLVQRQNLNHTRQRLLEVANCVDQILRTLDIQVVLTGLEVWTEQDHSPITQDANATLWAFLQWRRGLWARRPHDSTQLLTGRTFQGTMVGLAPVEGMCRAESSGGVSTDHSELPVGTAATMAHEIGHSLGLRHDSEGCCTEADAEQGGCVMEAATGYPFPRVFSACSRRQLRAFFRKGGGACLSSSPAPGLLVLPARCGDGFVEAGEECDCGSGQVRSSAPSPGTGADPCSQPPPGLACCPVTHPVLSSLTSGVSRPLLLCPQLLPACGGPMRPRRLLCAVPGEGSGNCGSKLGWYLPGPLTECELDPVCGLTWRSLGLSAKIPDSPLSLPSPNGSLAQLKSAGTPCRPAVSACDLPEFCTGTSPHCPADVYLLDGSPCAEGRGYCLDGWCPTLEQQCQQLWGPGSQPAPEPCFQEVNSVGNSQGNCGQDSKGSFLPCAERDAQCGKLLCQGGEPKPLVPHLVTVDSTVLLEGHKVACRGASVLPGAYLDQLDLSLVEPGTRCGPSMVCQDRHCRNATSQELERCLTACRNHGVCNSNHNCHCAAGWAPPFCDKPGPGGSMDSGPAQPANRVAFPLAVLLSFLLPLLPGAGLAWCYYQLPRLRQPPGWCCERGPMCNRPISSPCRDQPLGSVHPVELGSISTGEPSPLHPENSVLTSVRTALRSSTTQTCSILMVGKGSTPDPLHTPICISAKL